MTERALRFLDDLRAAEAAGAEVLAAWIDACAHDGLRGGLRTIRGRELAHAELLAERLRDLGAPMVATVADDVRQAAVARFGSREVSDEDKLALMLAHYPNDDDGRRAIAIVLPELAPDDAETAELLKLIADGEAATVAWLRAYLAGLSRRGDGARRPMGGRRAS